MSRGQVEPLTLCWVMDGVCYPARHIDGDGSPDDLGHVPCFTEGDFVFYLGDKTPFLVGKVTDRREGADGEAEVEVRWWSPATSAIRNNAPDCSMGECGEEKITAEYKTARNGEGSPMSSKGRKWRLVPDVKWMQAELVVASFQKLNSGDKISGGVFYAMNGRDSG